MDEVYGAVGVPDWRLDEGEVVEAAGGAGEEGRVGGCGGGGDDCDGKLGGGEIACEGAPGPAGADDEDVLSALGRHLLVLVDPDVIAMGVFV